MASATTTGIRQALLVAFTLDTVQQQLQYTKEAEASRVWEFRLTFRCSTAARFGTSSGSISTCGPPHVDKTIDFCTVLKGSLDERLAGNRTPLTRMHSDLYSAHNMEATTRSETTTTCAAPRSSASSTTRSASPTCASLIKERSPGCASEGDSLTL